MASKLKLKPLGGRVIVEPIEQEEMTAGGIILPETAKEKPQEGNVLAVGPGDRDEKTVPESPWKSRRATRCSSPSIPAPKSKWTARNCSSCARATFWPLLKVSSGGNQSWLQNNLYFLKKPGASSGPA